MSKNKEFQRVNESGLVNVVDEEEAGKVPLHYCAGKWYGPNRDGGFSPMKDTQAGVLLGQHGFSRSQKNENGNTPAEIIMLWLMQNRAVNYAGPLAGYPVGPHLSGSQRILVTEALNLVKVGKSGNPKHWQTIQTLIQSLLDDEQHDQITVFYVWLAASLRHLYERIERPGELPFQHCPALALFGEFQSGKTDSAYSSCRACCC